MKHWKREWVSMVATAALVAGAAFALTWLLVEVDSARVARAQEVSGPVDSGRLHARLRTLEEAAELVRRSQFHGVDLTAAHLEGQVLPLASALMGYLDGYWPDDWTHRERAQFSVRRAATMWMPAQANGDDLTVEDLGLAAELAEVIDVFIAAAED